MRPNPRYAIRYFESDYFPLIAADGYKVRTYATAAEAVDSLRDLRRDILKNAHAIELVEWLNNRPGRTVAKLPIEIPINPEFKYQRAT